MQRAKSTSVSSTSESKHFHVSKRPTRDVDFRKATPSTNVLERPVASEVFRAACLFRDCSDTSRFCGDAAYGCPAVADFIICALRNRASSLSTLKRVYQFVELFYNYATDRDLPIPFSGDASLLGITLWLKGPSMRGAAIPNFGKFALRVYGEALGVRFPLDHPAAKEAATQPMGWKAKTAPQSAPSLLSPSKGHPGTEKIPGDTACIVCCSHY